MCPSSSDQPETTHQNNDLPTPAGQAYLDELAAISAQQERELSHPQLEFDGAPEDLHARLSADIDALGPVLTELADDLAQKPETAFLETHACARISHLLTAHGCTAEIGVHGVPTSVKAVLSSPVPGPTLAVLAEYDALPEIGHACGHNVIAAMGLGAFLGLAQLSRQDPQAVPGTIIFLGTPAEEGHTGKEIMARHHAFAGLDAAVMAHGYSFDVADQLWLGRRHLRVRYVGKPAHASAQPFRGKNALDAANLLYQGIGLMRQQTPPTDRIHAVILEGGSRPSVIPETALMDIYVRSMAPSTLRELSARLDDAVTGAGLMTGCEIERQWDPHPPSLPVRTNTTLTSRWVQAQRRRGRDPLPKGVIPEVFAASTDFGNVSYRLPGMHPLIGFASADTALHTREFAAAAVSPQAHAAACDGAYGLAATLLDVLHDPALARAVREEFQAAGGALDVEKFFDPEP